MAPTMEAPATGGDNFTDIANMFAEAPGGSKSEADSTETASVETAPVGESAPDGAVATDATSTGDGATAATDPETGYALSEDGNSYIIPKADFGTLGGYKDYATKVQAMFPTANDAEIARFQASDYRGIRGDFLNGDENSIGNVLSYFAGQHQGLSPEEKQQFQASFSAMIPRGVDMLKTVNPEAYANVSNGISQSIISDAYAKAAETGSQDDLRIAQSIDWYHTGQYKTELPKEDPVQIAALASQKAFEAQQADLQKRETAAYDRDFTSFNTTQMDGPKWSALTTEIERTLAPVKDKYEPAMFKAVQRQVSEDIQANLKADYEWSRDHNIDRNTIVKAYQNAWKNNQSAQFLKPKLQAYQNDFMARVRRDLPSIAASYLGKATASAVAKAAPRTASAPPPSQAATRASNGQFQKPPAPEPFDVVDSVRSLFRAT